jgi:recombination protein RecA
MITHSHPVVTEQDKKTALDQAIVALDKRYGRGSLMRLGERPVQQVEVISTGALSLDLALGVGGYPRGRVVEIFGPEASGKTTLTLHAIAEMQRKGGTCAFVDAEHALDVPYARALGVDVDALLCSQPDSGEQALEVVETLVRTGAVDMIVIDSVAALVPSAELEGDMGDAHMGLQARLMSQALRKITAITSRTGTIVVFINQVRQKIGVSFGSGETTTGGNALKFYASVRIDIRRIGNITKDDEVIGARTKIKVVKNKLAPPFRIVETDMIFGRGICRAGDLIDLADEAGVLTKTGSWINLGDQRLGNGKEKVRERLLAEPALFDQVAAMVRGVGPSVLQIEA